MNALINTRFDRVVLFSNKDHDQTGFVRMMLPQVPDVGETVNLKGYPYVVLSRGWAYGEAGDEDEGQTYCYIRVLPAFNGYKDVGSDE